MRRGPPHPPGETGRCPGHHQGTAGWHHQALLALPISKRKIVEKRVALSLANIAALVFAAVRQHRMTDRLGGRLKEPWPSWWKLKQNLRRPKPQLRQRMLKTTRSHPPYKYAKKIRENMVDDEFEDGPQAEVPRSLEYGDWEGKMNRLQRAGEGTKTENKPNSILKDKRR
ncbi:hypothetical protein K469DRAFT_685549 [Zopfia rhizophila CBS 207.26]|uniref:Uncharacterized protein n=1 Tax=Zopfia rhizophila CBS 207.26 TaxID=1314779 RepID=A0A6A6E6V5_9PEZI|nr:hypothetical protein K469DRAFT_685549 [Zopfia rhizophila CBS 207.26]